VVVSKCNRQLCVNSDYVHGCVVHKFKYHNSHIYYGYDDDYNIK